MNESWEIETACRDNQLQKFGFHGGQEKGH